MFSLWLAGTTWANGIYRNGYGIRSLSLGGADVAWAEGPLSALGANAAGLGLFRHTTFELSLTGAIADGEFRNHANTDGHLHRPYGLVPEAAAAIPLGSGPVTLGFGVIPDALLSADWRYNDTPGGLDTKTSYGRQQHHAEIVVLRSALGAGVALGPKLSLGASLGVVYNRNTLETPYIFQTQPALRGVKTLLDLQTDGFGYNGNFGLLFRPHESLQLGLAYTTETTVSSQGRASGNALAQLQSLGGAFSAFRPDFRYDAEVINHFPQTLSGGLSWHAHARLRLALQVDWIQWNGAFDQLRIKLTRGNNADLNRLVGADVAEDFVPLHWRDRFVSRAGVEFAATDQLRLRAGYAYGKSPVPDHTLSPLTAAILEHTISAGVGYGRGRYQFNFGYQYDFRTDRSVHGSVLRAGEYTNSRIEAGIHWFGISTTIRF